MWCLRFNFVIQIMYSIYQTEAIVLGGVQSREASRFLFLFTKEFGLIGAYAQGVRELKSKLRYSLQDFAYAYVDIVQGKNNGWRIAGALNHENFIPVHFIARICSLLRRLLKGEEKNSLLFEDVVGAFVFLKKKEVNHEELKNLEIILVMKILNHLGYWGENKLLSPFLYCDIQAPHTLKQITPLRHLAVREINKSLKESQL